MLRQIYHGDIAFYLKLIMKNNLKTAEGIRRTSCFNDFKISALLKKDLLQEKRDEDLKMRNDI